MPTFLFFKILFMYLSETERWGGGGAGTGSGRGVRPRVRSRPKAAAQPWAAEQLRMRRVGPADGRCTSGGCLGKGLLRAIGSRPPPLRPPALTGEGNGRKGGTWGLGGWTPALGLGRDPGELGRSPAPGSLRGACFSPCLCLCLSLCVSHE